MPLTKVKDRFQITIPSTIRRQLHLKVGDILETVLEDQRIVLKVKALVDRPLASEEHPEKRTSGPLPKPPSLKDVDPDRPGDIERFLDAREMAMSGPGQLPQTPSPEERRRLLQLLQGSAENGELDFPIDEIQASRTCKKPPIPFD